MAGIVLKVGTSDEFDEENRVDTERNTQATVSFDIRKTLGGDLAIVAEVVALRGLQEEQGGSSARRWRRPHARMARWESRWRSW